MMNNDDPHHRLLDEELSTVQNVKIKIGGTGRRKPLHFQRSVYEILGVICCAVIEKGFNIGE